MKMKRHKVRVFGLILFCMATTLIFLPQIGICAKSSTIQKVTESESEFSKPPTMTGYEAPLTDQHRIYHRASTGFVSIESIRISAEKRATDFCKRQNQNMNVVSEQFSKPPYIFGRFLRIEIIFACSTDGTDKLTVAERQSQDEKIQIAVQTPLISTGDHSTRRLALPPLQLELS